MWCQRFKLVLVTMVAVLLVGGRLPSILSAFYINLALLNWGKAGSLESLSLFSWLAESLDGEPIVRPVPIYVIDMLDNALVWNSHNSSAVYYRGIVALIEGQYDFAIHSAETLRTDGSERLGLTTFMLGSGHYFMGDWLAAFDDWRIFPDSEVVFERFGSFTACQIAIQLVSDSSDAYYCLGKAFAKLGKTVEAEAAWKRAISLDRSYNTVNIIGVEDVYSKAQTLYRIGLLYYENGQWQDAYNYFKQALDIEPGHYWASLFLPLAKYQLNGNTEDAINALESVVQRYPQHVNAMYQLSLLCINQSDLTRALEWADRAVAVAPQFTEGYLVRGRVYLLKGDAKSALNDFQTVILRNEYLAETYTYAARAAFDLADYRLALQYIRSALSDTPNDTDKLLLLGDIYLSMGDSSLAAQSYQDALRLAPDRTDIKNRLLLVKP